MSVSTAATPLRTRGPGGTHSDGQWRTSRHSHGACVQAKPLDLTVRDGVPVIDEAGPLDATTERTGTPAERGQETAGPRPPWYVEHGMLGEVTVAAVLRWTADEAAVATSHAVAGLDLAAGDARIATLVRSKITELLASDDPAVWDMRLERGEMHVADGRLVWIRPELADPVLAEEVDAAALRKYDVRFASTASTSEQNRSQTSGLESLLFTAVGLASAAASTQVVALPTPSASASTSASRTVTTSVVTGRKLFVSRSSRFVGGVRFRVFVDGVEVEGTPRPVERGIAVDFPSIFTSSDEPRPALTTPAQHPSAEQALLARPLTGDEVLHAVDLTPVVAAEQARLRSAGISAPDALSVVSQVQDVLNERNARNNSRWWLTTGSASREVSTGRGAPLLRRITGGFRGHVRVEMSVQGLQRLGTTDDVPTRTDLGAGRGMTRGAGSSSTAAVTVAVNTIGLAAPTPENATEPVRVRGIAPLAGVTLNRSREWSRRQTSKTATHTVLNATAQQTRYRAVLAITVAWESTNHSALRRRPSLTTRTNSDIGVPQLGTRGAADFEQRLLGTVSSETPGVVSVEDATSAGLATAPSRTTGPWPLVQALPRAAARLRHTTTFRPAVLDNRHRPRAREPLALASRRGLGFAVGSTLPGSELVAEHFHARLEQLARQRGIDGVDWATVRRELTVHFGTPRLEGDLDAAIAGIRHTVRVGGRQVHLMLRLHLTDAVGTTQYEAVTNARAVVDESVVGQSSSKWAIQGTVGGAVQLTVPEARIQAAVLRLTGQFFRGHGEQFSTGTSTYRRVENVGSVDEHTINAVYESSLYVEGDRDLHPERWWTHDPTNIVATVLVPSQHVPTNAITDADAENAGTLQAAGWWPRGPVLNLAAGTAGLYPAFLTLPALARISADLYAQLHQLPKAWVGNDVHWPSEILDLARPTWLAARLGMLTGPEGVTVELPERDGWRTTVHLEMRAYDPRILQTGGETEIEQYSKGTQHRSLETERGGTIGVQAGFGPQLRVGRNTADDDLEVVGDDVHRGQGSGTAGPGGRFVVLAHAGAEGSHTRTAKQTTGFLDITRATYAGSKTTIRADPVFRLTVSRKRAGRSGHEFLLRHLRFDSALDVVVPERRALDIAPALHLVDPVAQGSPRTYAGIGLPRTSAHTERLGADSVLEAIVSQLTRHGALRARADGIGGRADPLRQALEAVFRPDALIAQMPNLLTSGVWAWFPVTGFAGSTSYLWTRVTIDRVDGATNGRPRPEVKLTLRGESLDEAEDSTHSGLTVLGGASLVAHGGRTSGQGHGHGGAELRAGGLRTTAATTTSSTRSVDIYRLGTRDREGSYEFEHTVAFKVETALAHQPPEIVAVVADAMGTLARGVRPISHRLARITARPATPLEQTAATPLTDHASQLQARSGRPRWLWHETQTVQGDVRLLVPFHMTAETTSEAAVPAVFRRTFGRAPRWEPATAMVQGAPPDLVEHLHPGDVNADAIHRWAWLAAVRTAQAPVLEEHQDRSSTDLAARSGLEPFHDLAYLHDTSHGAVRPRIGQLLTGTYEVRVGTETVLVGFELRAARELLPGQEVESKARRYQQVDSATESGRSRSTGWFAAVGPEGNGSTGNQSFVGRVPFERKQVTGEKRSARDSTTHETNQEGTVRFRHFVFDVTLVARHARAPRRVLRVDVPDGLVGALPLEGGRLAGDLTTSMGWLLTDQATQRAPVDRLNTSPPVTGRAATVHADHGSSGIVWRASSHSDGVACVSATVLLLRCAPSAPR